MRTIGMALPRTIRSPYLLLTLAPLCWSGNWLLGRAMHAEVDPIGLNFWRWSVALAVLLPFTWRHLVVLREVLLREWKIIGVLGFLGVTLFHTLVYLALNFTTAINATLFNSVVPIAIVGISWLLFRETVSVRQALGIVISLVGVVAIVTRGDPALLWQLRFNPGDLWALASVPVWSLYTVLLKRRPPELQPMVLLAAMALVGVLLLAPFYLLEFLLSGSLTGRGMQFNLPTVVTVLYTAVFASVIAVAFWNTGVASLGANRGGLFIHLLPVYTTVLAILFLGEGFFLYHGLGIVLIFAGIYLTTVAQAASVWERRGVRRSGSL